MHLVRLLTLAILALLWNCSSNPPTTRTQEETIALPWAKIKTLASGTTVNFMMWQGSPAVNAYINNYVVPSLKEKYDIDLHITGGQGPEIVQLIMGEKEASVSEGQVDIVWINGETFFQLRRINGLYGPFVEKLPNSTYIDFDNPFISIDFQQPVDFMECPWSITQFSLIHDTLRIPNPPRTLAQLESFVRTHPGTFTISNDFSGMTLLKSMLAELSGSSTGLDGPFDEAKYEHLSQQLWDYLNRNKAYFWKEGSTFPKEHSIMDQMFASGELLLSFGFSEGGIEEKVNRGLFPKSTRGYAWQNGTVLNSNYLGIPYNTSNLAGALVAINFMISPEAQFKKADPAGMDANTVLNVDRLPTEWQEKFRERSMRQYGPTLDALSPYTIKEPAPEYMIRLYEDFRTEVIAQ